VIAAASLLAENAEFYGVAPLKGDGPELIRPAA
jgi:hypothetical protein